MADDEQFMRKALELARRGQGRVEPNPMVGAVLVRDGRIIAQGWHQRFGGPHAEVNCLRGAGAIHADDVLYVTLEPCSHTGQTGPCTEAIIAAGVKRVVVAMVDPSPHAAGRGLAILRDAGIGVTAGVCEAQARELTAPFVKRVTTGLPWVIAKWAQTLDGKIATSEGDSKWISSEASRHIVHELRARVDAIMVGVGTVLADDPSLTARPRKGVTVKRVAKRVIVDPHGRTPVHAKVRQQPPETVFVGGDLRASLQRLAADGATNVLIEGGATLLGHLFAQNLIDEVLVFLAPKVLGDAAGLDAVRGLTAPKVAHALQLSLQHIERVGEDVMLRYRRGGRPA